MKTSYISTSALTLLGTALLLAGCNDAAVDAPEAPASTATSEEDHGHPHESDGGHSHGAGPHDGTLTDWGGGKYHVEFTVDHDNQEATVYVLGSDEKTPEPITAEKLLLTIKDPELQTDLMPVPLDGEGDGKSSRFVGNHEGLGVVQEYAGTISAEVEGTPYAGDFEEVAHGHEH